mmetsp:Transcript_7355/g.6596  ORF Transcript_7355/g.6596 Transcript_7355/m.6596 type:complete len:699 (+) Transcript_7355:77-2173(+)
MQYPDYINDNVKQYSASKKIKSRKANRHKYRKAKDVQKALKEYRRIHSKSYDEDEYDSYNMSYLNRFSTHFHKLRIEQKAPSHRHKLIQAIRKQNDNRSKSNRLKCSDTKSQRTKSIKKILSKAGYTKYDINDLITLNSNTKSLRKSCPDRNHGYDDMNHGFGHFHGEYNPKVSIIPAEQDYTMYGKFYEFQKAQIEQQCNFTGCRLIGTEDLEFHSKSTKQKKAVTKWKLLLLFYETYYCWLEVDYYMLVNHPEWFNKWIATEMGRVEERYRDECIKHHHIKLQQTANYNYQYWWTGFDDECFKSTVNIEICSSCDKYSCKSCIHKGKCKTCINENERKRLTKVIASALEMHDGGIAKILMEFSTGKMLKCHSRECDRELNTNNIFEYHSIKDKYKYRKLLCPGCKKNLMLNRARAKPKPEIQVWEAVEDFTKRLNVKYSYLDIKEEELEYENSMENWSGGVNQKYTFRYSNRGWVKFMEKLKSDGVKLPTRIRPKCNPSPTARKIRNALFITNFDIMGVDTHWDLTQLLLNYGDLKKQVFIGIDRNKRPFAVIQFMEDESAELCKLDGLYDRHRKMHIEWVDRKVDEFEYPEDEIVEEDMSVMMSKSENHCGVDNNQQDIKMYNKSRQYRKRQKKLVMRNKKEEKKRKFGKSYGDNNKRWNDKKMNKRANKRFVMRCCKLEMENVKNNYFDYAFVH